MTHPRESIARAQDEELTSAERALVESHLGRCEACRRLNAELASDERRLRMPEPLAGPGLAPIAHGGRSPVAVVAALLVAMAVGLASGLGIGAIRAGTGAAQSSGASPSPTRAPAASIILGTPAAGQFAGLIYNEPVRAADGWHFTGTVRGGPTVLTDVRVEIDFPDGSLVSGLVASSLAPGESATFDVVAQRADIADWSPRIRLTFRR